MKPLHSPFIYFFLVLFLLATSVEAQLTKMPLPKYEPNGMGYKTTRADDTIYVALPFYEDFATFQLGRPDVAKWEDGSGVFINNSLGIRLLSAGMATFGLSQDGTNYFDLHHTASDTMNKIVPEEIAQNVAAWVVFVALAAEYKGDFGFNLNTENP